jgi:succinate dehydrogenase / fumarate reductase membrane anchor subunit
MVTIETPKSPRSRKSAGREKLLWLFMRGSGLVLIILIFGHLFVNMFSGGGVKAIDFAFVAGKWANPFWQVYDTLMLWLALIHGTNGMRTLVNDYTNREGIRKFLNVSLVTICVLLIVLGTLVTTTFDPCGDTSVTHLLPAEFCSAK